MKITGAAHIGLTVKDMHAAAAWYQRVFGWQLVRQFAAGEAGSPRVLLYDPVSRFALSVCQPDDASGDAFDFRRTGLDHFALGVADMQELEAWVRHLDTLGIEHSSIRDLGRARFVAFQDIDGIQIELWLQLVQPNGQPL